MNTKEYERLQARLTALQNKQERQPSSGKSWRDGWRDAILAAKSMIHSEFKAEPLWIPVSERLPEDDVSVLVSDNNGGVWRSHTYRDIEDKIRFAWVDNDTVLAWMPFPEPYEVEHDD